MKTPRFELKDFRLNEILSMLTPHSGPSLSEELNRVWTGEARTIKFGNRFSVDLTSEDVKENPEFRPNEWNPTKSWNIPQNVDLMFSIQENESGKEIARLRGHFDGEGSSSKALFNFALRELLSITQAKFLCKRLFRVLLKSFLRISEDQAESPCTHFAVDFMQRSTNRSSSVGLMIKKASGSLGTF